jgi:hypothetical protein
LSWLPLNCDILVPGDDEVIFAGPLRIRGWHLPAMAASTLRLTKAARGGKPSCNP